jgi:hypothetical protein
LLLPFDSNSFQPEDTPQNTLLSIDVPKENSIFNPLEKIKIKAKKSGKFQVFDGNGQLYFESKKSVDSIEFTVAGALGTHFIVLLDGKNKLLGCLTFLVDCKTQIIDEKGVYKDFLHLLEFTLKREKEWGETTTFKMDGRVFSVFVAWIRDHTHTMKAMKYFHPQLKDAVDLFAASQREDGMIFDNIYPRPAEPIWWDATLKKGNFNKKIEGGDFHFVRQPSEADVEYLFVECLYFSWKATGDSQWMAARLENAERAIKYSLTDRYRWSEKYKLVKRGFTIDTWDFVHEYDRQKTGYGSGQCIDPGTNEFGIMHGDNTGIVAVMRFLAEMNEVLDRKQVAEKWLKTANEIEERLNTLSWNGNFFTHYVPENSDFWQKRNIGKTNPAIQVSLSNTYALNRGISEDKKIAIVNQYKAIKKELPKGSPGEYYTIYPPFENGFGHDNELYDYMNGGMITIAAGELALGAFETGNEDYGVEILNKMYQLGKKHKNYLPCTFKGARFEKPKANFEQINLSKNVNASFSGKKIGKGLTWNDEENDLANMPFGKQVFCNVPFEVIDPANNENKGALILSNEIGFGSKTSVEINRKAQYINLLHARTREELVAFFKINYDDGSSFVQYVLGENSGNWWYPESGKNWKVAFGVPNKKALRVGMGVSSFKNPNPNKIIKNIEFEVVQDNPHKWYVAALTLADSAVELEYDELSFGIPDRWGAAAVVYALFEGLAGVKDKGVCFSKLKFSPKWVAANVQKVETIIRYPASNGYVKYRYQADKQQISILGTYAGNKMEAEILIPSGKNVSSVLVNGKAIDFKTKRIQNSNYILFELEKTPLFDLIIKF